MMMMKAMILSGLGDTQLYLLLLSLQRMVMELFTKATCLRFGSILSRKVREMNSSTIPLFSHYYWFLPND
jgi:hypothetical protein